MNTIVIAVANQKGGVGKSTTAACVATELALREYTTLLIDADPQANATQIFLDPENVTDSLADVILGGGSEPAHSIREKRVTTAIPHLHLVPAKLQLANFDRENPLAIIKLRTAVREVSDRYDFVIIDTPPNLGLLLTAALTAATHVLIPIQAAPFALSGYDDLMDAIKGAQGVNERLAILGAVCTMYDTRVAVSGKTLKSIQEKAKERLFKTIIHRQTKLEESPSMHQPIQLYAPNSRGAELYSELTDEILERLNMSAKAPHLKVVKSDAK
ncbi:MAG TPA: ParA family protein [Pyrinomonadaceae bacterium]|jgi:chromosome partitioning protein